MVTKVTWQFSGQGRDDCGTSGAGQGAGPHLALHTDPHRPGPTWPRSPRAAGEAGCRRPGPREGLAAEQGLCQPG